MAGCLCWPGSKRFGLSVEDLVTIYIGFVCPFLNGAYRETTPGFGAYSEEGVQNHLSSYQDALVICNMPDLRSRCDKICWDFATKLYESQHFRSWLPTLRSEVVKVPLRNSNMMTLPKVRMQRYANSAIPYMVKKWKGQYKNSSLCFTVSCDLLIIPWLDWVPALICPRCF